MAAKYHWKEWKWTLLMMMCYIRYSFATETAIVMTKLPGVLYKAKLNVNSPDVKHLANLSATATRCVYNKFTNEIVWGEGNLIKTLSLSDGGTPSTINAGVTVRDVAVDSMTGHIFFTGIHVLKSMNSGGIIYQIPVTVIRIHSMTIDAFNRRICFCGATENRLVCVDLASLSNVKWYIINHCEWISYHDGYFYWMYSGTIRRSSLLVRNDYQSMLIEKRIDSFSLFGNNIYGVSTADPILYKVNTNNVSDVTMFDLKLKDMAFVSAFETPEIKCPTSIPNGWLPHYCKAIVDESCDDYTCNRGYQRNVAVVSLTCTESANWNHNVSSLCLETKCPTSIPNGRLPYDCKAIVTETCGNYTCEKGYHRNKTVLPLTCTESGNWNNNESSLCIETKCPTSIPNGRLPYDCKAIVTETCGNYTCEKGYHRNKTVLPLTCTESGNWNNNESSLCIEIATVVNPDIKTTVVIVTIASSIVLVVASSIVLLVKKWKHVPKHCCGENNTAEGLQLQRDDYLHAVFSLESRASVDHTQTSTASSDHYDNINSELPEEDYYLTVIGALSGQDY